MQLNHCKVVPGGPVNSMSVMRQLARIRLDKRFSMLRDTCCENVQMPRGGWIRAIREALGMPRHALGRRMGLGEKRVAQLEQGEAQGRLSMSSMARAAEALDCELVVALIPRRPLEETISDRRRELAMAWFNSRVRHTMSLEGQSVSIEDLSADVLSEIQRQFPDERLWDER